MSKNWLHEPVWFTAPDGSSDSLWKSSPSAPPPPDYKGAATAQGAANVDTAIAEGVLNHPNQITPYGSLTNTQTGSYTTPGGQAVPQFTSQVDLTPLGNERFQQEQRINSGLGALAEGGIERVGGQLGTPFDMSQVPNAPNLNDNTSRDAMVNALMQRQQPFMDRAREQKENALTVGGFNPGGEAWKSSQDDLARAENDARMAAIAAGGAEQSREYGLQQDARQQAIQQQQFLRSLPLNEINALRTGSQVQMPQFQGPGSANIAPAPIFNATTQQGQYDQGVYNQQAASANAGNAATMQGIGTAAAVAAMFF